MTSINIQEYGGPRNYDSAVFRKASSKFLVFIQLLFLLQNVEVYRPCDENQLQRRHDAKYLQISIPEKAKGENNERSRWIKTNIGLYLEESCSELNPIETSIAKMPLQMLSWGMYQTQIKRPNWNRLIQFIMAKITSTFSVKNILGW